MGASKGGVFTTDTGDGYGHVDYGLRGKNVVALLIDNDYLYAATKGDGIFRNKKGTKEWRNIGLVGEDLSALVIHDNKLYAGTHGGKFLETGARIENWIKIGLATESITSLHGYNGLYAGTLSGWLYQSLDRKKWDNCWNQQIRHTCIHRGKLYGISFSGQAYEISIGADGSIRFDFYGNSLEKDGVKVIASFKSSLYAGTDKGVYVLGEDTFWRSIVAGDSVLEDLEINVLYPIENKLFIGTSKGIYIYETADGENLIDVVGLKDQYIYSLYKHNGYIYAGTKTGIYRSCTGCNDSTWRLTLPHKTAKSFYSDNFFLYAGTTSENNIGKIFISKYGDKWNEIYSFQGNIQVFEEYKGVLYMGTSNGIYEQRFE